MTEQTMPLMDHLRELRNRIITVVAAIVAGSVLAFVFNEQLLDFLIEPYQLAVPDAGLAFFKPTEAFSLIMKLSLWGGVILASPVILWQIWMFSAPALTKREKRWAIPLVAIFVVLFVGGIAVGYYLALRRGLGFLLGFGGDSLEPVVGGQFYLSFAMRFLLAFGISFEFPVFLFAAGAAGIVGSAKLRSSRRGVAVTILIFAAFITPSGDPYTLLMLAAPMYLFYEVTILLIRFVLKR
jgi:sec-independent protein translocase protein TatC